MVNDKEQRLVSGPVNTTLKEFENGVFTLKTHQTFSVQTGQEEFNNATITDHFGLVFEKNSSREIAWLMGTSSFSFAAKCFLRPHKTEKPAFTKFLRRLFSKSYVVVTDSVWTVSLP